MFKLLVNKGFAFKFLQGVTSFSVPGIAHVEYNS